MLRKIRILLAIIFLIGITSLFLDFSGTVQPWLGWMAKLQFLPSVLALNVISIVVVLGLTLAMGRLYCSVICPLGVMQDFFAWIGKWRIFRKNKKTKAANKYSHSKPKTWLRLGVLGLMVVMILAGSIEERKGQLVLLESLSLLSAEIMDQLEIYLIGSTLDENIETLLKESAYDCLKLMGVMQHNDLMALFEKMDILLCPSLDDPMPIVCTEAMMLSKPIIVSDCTGTASFINEGENGYIVKAGDAHSLALAIEKAVKSKILLPSLGEKARSVFDNNFTNEVFEQRIKEKLIPVIYS